jgi:hypothetical protein
MVVTLSIYMFLLDWWNISSVYPNGTLLETTDCNFTITEASKHKQPSQSSESTTNAAAAIATIAPTIAPTSTSTELDSGDESGESTMDSSSHNKEGRINNGDGNEFQDDDEDEAATSTATATTDPKRLGDGDEHDGVGKMNIDEDEETSSIHDNGPTVPATTAPTKIDDGDKDSRDKIESSDDRETVGNNDNEFLENATATASTVPNKVDTGGDDGGEDETKSGVEETDTNNNDSISNDDGLLLIDPFERQPECALLRDGEVPAMKDFLRKHGKYVSVAERIAEKGGPRYDQTCFILKPRYNCARNVKNTTNHGPYAYDFALALKSPIGNHTCDLQQFIDDAGGPAGIGRRILQNHRNKTIKKQEQEQSVVEVLLLGTSRFRQLFEALACGFSDQITDFFVVKDAKLKNKKHPEFYNESDVAAFVDMEYVKNGSCYNPRKQFIFDKYYWDDGTVIPKNYDLCHDGIGRVQFGDLRFSYIFRPWAWLNTSTPFHMVGAEINADQPVDLVLWEPQDVSKSTPAWKRLEKDEHGKRMPLETLYDKSFEIRTPVSLTKHDAKKIYTDLQVRDTGRYFGADNPWIWDPPDVAHPCMPGQPDDKINFLLWYMLSVSTLK